MNFFILFIVCLILSVSACVPVRRYDPAISNDDIVAKIRFVSEYEKSFLNYAVFPNKNEDCEIDESYELIARFKKNDFSKEHVSLGMLGDAPFDPASMHEVVAASGKDFHIWASIHRFVPFVGAIQCSAMESFIPHPGYQYEVRLRITDVGCDIDVFKLEKASGVMPDRAIGRAKIDTLRPVLQCYHP